MRLADDGPGGEGLPSSRSRLAARLDEKAFVERRERRGQIHPTIDKASNELRADENRRGKGTSARPFGRRGLTDHGAARVADLQRYNALPRCER
mgnify:CR=1 FL=1